MLSTTKVLFTYRKFTEYIEAFAVTLHQGVHPHRFHTKLQLMLLLTFIQHPQAKSQFDKQMTMRKNLFRFSHYHFHLS